MFAARDPAGVQVTPGLECTVSLAMLHMDGTDV